MLNNKAAFFIVIDGIDGCGKTTIGQFIYQYLSSKSKKAFLTREPGGSSFFGSIRQLLLHKETNIEVLTETLLFFADRCEHIKKIIEPQLNFGVNVICDRFIASTYAYQCFGRGVEVELINTLRKYVVPFMPDITFILDVDLEVAAKRLNNKATSKKTATDESRFEKMGEEFYAKVKKGFLWYAKTFENVYVINANMDKDSVFTEIKNHLEHLIK